MSREIVLPGNMARHWQIYVQHVQPYGIIPNTKGGNACWDYCRIAYTSLQSVDSGAQYEGERDHQNSLNNIARAVAVKYGLESPSDFLKYMELAKAEAERSELPWDPRIENPGAYSFVKQGN